MKQRGVVQWFDAAKACGYIIRSGAPDVFFRLPTTPSGSDWSLEAGDTVEFALTCNAGLLEAREVQKVTQP